MQDGVKGFFAKLTRREPNPGATPVRVVPTVVTERVRIVNPYHAVSIVGGSQACDAVKAQVGRRYLSSEAPRLPLVECGKPECRCHYAHHDDRRTRARRIADGRDAHPSAPYSGPERRLRSSAGRRDHD
jgi:hypothetical protein